MVGAERSGTTLLRLMLDHHPVLTFHHESEFMVSQMPDGGGWPDMQAYRAWRQTDRVFLHSRFDIDELLDYPELMASFLEQKRSRDDKIHVGATIHYGFDRLLRIWPSARFIHVVRDPRDVAPSVIQMGWAGNAWAAVERWVDAERTWSKVVAETDPSQRIVIRYADLIEDCEGTLRNICRFLGLEYSDRMLAYPEHSSYTLPDVNRLRRWQTRLPDRDVQLVEARVGGLLEARGFEPSGLPALQVSEWKRRWLELQSHMARARHRMRQYGLRLYLQELLARRMGWTGLMQRIRPRLHQVEEAALR